MTPDGIDAADWDRVHELAVDIANCSIAEDGAGETRARISLIAKLDEPDDKCGANIQRGPGRTEVLIRRAAARQDVAGHRMCRIRR